MMCLYPKLVLNKKYTSTKKNGGNVPVCHDERLRYITAACGRCYECMKQKSRAWQVRMSEEIRQNRNGVFVTLTINDEEYKKLEIECEIKNENEIATKAVRRWLERIRKEKGKSVKHWLITEKGHEGSKRVHLHGIVWDDDGEKWCREKWQYGYVFIGTHVTEQTVMYITKYMTKIDEKNKDFKGKILCSAGIGAGYIDRKDAENNKYKKGDTNETYRLKNGIKLNLPIYYRNKIYSEEEREELFKEKLDKGEVWICGEMVEIEDQETYTETMQYYRKRHIQLNRDNVEEWDKEKYIKKLKKQRDYYTGEEQRLKKKE